MINPFSRGFLLDRAGEPAVADTPPKIDPGAPYYHEDKPADKTPPKPEKSAIDKEVERLTNELKASKEEAKRLQASEQYWSDRARNTNAAPKDPDPDPDPEPIKADPFEGEKPEKFLDDLSTEGKLALFKRGVITEKQLTDSLKNLESNVLAKVDEKINTITRHNQVDAQLAQYPELIEDTKRVQRGEAPQTDLYRRTQANFKEMIDADPAMRNSPAALVTAAKNAKKELTMEAELEAARRGEKQTSRRARIDATNPDRDASGTEGGGESDQLSPTQRSIVNSLSRYGATEEDFNHFAKMPMNGRK